MRLVIPVAVLIILSSIAFVSVRAGIAIGKARARKEQDAIDPVLHAELIHFTRSVLAPPETVDDVVVLPSWMRKQLGEPLMKKLAPARRAVR